ncbi:hypothetical protein [Streptacidiphilus monticola]|uniref:Uncharacterized protein n=1 Tax=Streptacidiphilus monticola TaxID=2161674 RepID=A0ABW1FUQ9_9ACTN
MPDDPYCATPRPADAPAPARPGEPMADCVLCGEPTEYPADAPGAPQCPRCEWQQAQRGACSG